MKRKSSRVIVYAKDTKDKVYLIFRRKYGEEYFVVPGGGVEDGETFTDAAVREIKEELGLIIDNLKELDTFELENDICKIFTATEVEKGIATGEELKNVDPNNYYEIQLHELKNIRNVNLKPDFYQGIIKKLY